MVVNNSDFVYFLKIARKPAPFISLSVVVDRNLNVLLFKKDGKLRH